MLDAFKRVNLFLLLLLLSVLACNLPTEQAVQSQTSVPDLITTETPLLSPSVTNSPPATATPTPHLPAALWEDDVQANLYARPEEGAEILGILPIGSRLSIIARSQDYTWLQVSSLDGATGWLPASLLNTGGCLDPLPAQLSDANYQPQPPISINSERYSYLSGLCGRSREIFLHGQELGNRAEIFSKVGDSITLSTHFLAPVGRGNYQLGEYAHLEDVIEYYTAADARTGNSFVNTSLSAYGGWSSWTVINYHAADPGLCLANEIPLECELRLVKPAVALIMLGTNDAADPDLITPAFYEENMRKIIEICIQRGVIPILSTVPELFLADLGQRVPIFNQIIIRLADEYEIPLWDYHAALKKLPNSGLLYDGVHPSVAPSGAGDFSSIGLQYGMNVRNLTAIQALDAIWRALIIDKTEG